MAKTRLFGSDAVATGNVRLLIAMAWMEGFREGAEAAGGDLNEAFRTAGGVNRLSVATSQVLARTQKED